MCSLGRSQAPWVSLLLWTNAVVGCNIVLRFSLMIQTWRQGFIPKYKKHYFCGNVRNDRGRNKKLNNDWLFAMIIYANIPA